MVPSRPMRTMWALVFLLAAGVAACDGCDGCDSNESDQPKAEGEPARPEPEPDAEPPGPDPTEEACLRVLMVAWEGAEGADPEVDRSKEEARARIEEAHQAVEEGEASFPVLAHRYSDLPRGKQRSGVAGTYPRGRWPSDLAYAEDVVFDLEPGQTSDILETEQGFAIVGRCPVQQIDLRFVLIGHEDAEGAPSKSKRSKEEARKRAEELRQQVLQGADIAEIAREHSEDPNTADEGGSLKNVKPGLMDPRFEDAAFALDVDEVSDVVESRFGMVFIKRLNGDGKEAPKPDTEP